MNADRYALSVTVLLCLIPLSPGSGHARGDQVDVKALLKVADAVAPTGATTLYQQTFDPGCTPAGWTTVDRTAQVADYFHVDDFAGLSLAPLAGTKSLWCGARPGALSPLCSYASLPGYGNGWDQAWCTKTCITVSGDGLLDVSFLGEIDTEPEFDALTLEYTFDCTGATGWTVLDGGPGVWDGNVAITGGAYSLSGGPVRVRLRFNSDVAWSDEDGLWNTDGAAIIDNLLVEGLALEDFEGEAVGATSSNDWQSCTPPGFGQHMGIFPGLAQVQESTSYTDLTCLWAAIENSTESYGCGGFPSQTAVPKGNAQGQYLWNEIWSPNITLAGSGDFVYLFFRVYVDNPIENLTFYTWNVRHVSGSCPSPWMNEGFLYYGKDKEWYEQRVDISSLLDLNASTMQISLGVVDMCKYWCGIKGDGLCHSHAPLFDTITVYRSSVKIPLAPGGDPSPLVSVAPTWQVRDIDQFQDTFSTDGTITGPGRADMAKDISPAANWGSIIPGDSAVVRVKATGGLALDPGLSRPAVYLYLTVFPHQSAKSGSVVQAPELRNGNPRYPFIDTWTDASAVVWTRVLMDEVVVGPNGVVIADRYCVDLKDDLFTPGDEVRFFYGAVGSSGVESFRHGPSLEETTLNQEEAAAAPSEFSILPINGTGSGMNDILYVDAADGHGNQLYFDTALQTLGLLDQIDRYDVRGPSSFVSNRPDSRVGNVATQLNGPYRKIIWDAGDLQVGLGNGSGMPDKANDYELLYEFLGGLTEPGGVYLAGNDLPYWLDKYQGSTHPGGVWAIAFESTYIPYALTTGKHWQLYGVSPVGVSIPGGGFISDPTFVIHGGETPRKAFDAMTPLGPTRNEIAFGPGTAASSNGALLSCITNNGSTDVGVLLGGFSFAYIRDDDVDGINDRSHFLYDVIVWLSNTPGLPTHAVPVGTNSLAQNYPNPFNPQTMIAFSVKDRGRVRISIYDVTGALTRTLVDEEFTPGAHTRAWDGRNNEGQAVASGVYFYRLATTSFLQTRKMILLR